MNKYIIEHKIALMRIVGGLLLAIGIISLFWSKPEAVMSENEIAEANIARMEASLPQNKASKQKKEASPFMESYKEKQKEHIRYTVIALMIGGVLFIGYSFISKKEHREE